MPHRFAEIAFTPAVVATQSAYGSRDANSRMQRFGGPNDTLGVDEEEFLADRDSFYLATVSETGWPYIQHRGGPAGFLKILDEKTLGFADFRGNAQLISTGNLSKDDRVAIFVMDYPRKTRLKILGHAKVLSPAENADLLARLQVEGYKGRVERLFLITLEAFDWNCQQHIVPRFTADQVEDVVSSLRHRIAALESENRALKASG